MMGNLYAASLWGSNRVTLSPILEYSGRSGRNCAMPLATTIPYLPDSSLLIARTGTTTATIRRRICEAVEQFLMRFVPDKNAPQQGPQALHRTRFELIKWRRAMATGIVKRS